MTKKRKPKPRSEPAERPAELPEPLPLPGGEVPEVLEETPEEPEPEPEPEESEEKTGPGHALDYEPSGWVPVKCPKCGSSKRAPFKGRTRTIEHGRVFHAHFKIWYDTVVLRPTKCLDCGQAIMTKEFVDRDPSREGEGSSDGGN